ncbi:outer dynein arm-docking complex subunit 4 [Tribolium castaneum]|uniref:outer dynein arm-docking complex subunit 4 n=1 Tax=Tribolium castaneum TaxID=7070 RepID=UPI0030FE8B9B
MASPFKKEEVYGFKTLYRELGYYISRLEQYERALKFFDEAIAKTPNDRRALMGRAWARSKACKYEGALDDIRTALNLDPDDLVMLAHKALNTYLNCEFEDGLVQNTRLLPIRKKPDYFQMGAMHCADAIENCLGERAGRPLRDHYLIIRRLAWKKNFEEQKRFQPKSRYKKKKKKKIVLPDKVTSKGDPIIPLKSSRNLNQQSLTSENTLTQVDEPPTDRESIVDSIYSLKSERNILPPPIKFPYRPLQRYTSNIENYMAEKYLDTLYKDKLFLKNLPTEPGISCPNEAGTKKILLLAKTGYKTVKYKQELLRARRPFYFIKYQEATSSGALKVRQEQQLNKLRDAAKKEADSIVSKMKDALEEKGWKSVLETAEKLKTFCDLKSRKILPDRDTYLEVLYDTVCQAHYDLKRINKNQLEWDQEKRIYKMLGLHLSREPSTDSVITQFKGVFIDWKKQITVYGDRLRKATTPKEMCWLYHELSRFHTELKQYELARVYARKCMNEGKRTENNKWVINALLLIMRINIAQHSKNDAKSDAQAAIELATQMGDKNLIAFLNKCKQVIEKVAFDEKLGPKVLMQREQKIVEMMAGDKMKDEAAHLFRMMSAMPAARRMSVMPGIRITDDDDDKKAMASRKQSIMPGVPKPAEFAMTTPTQKQKKGGKQVSIDESSKGVGFVELIKYHIDD